MTRIKNFFSGPLREKALRIYHYEFHLGWLITLFVILYTILMVGLFFFNTNENTNEPLYIDPIPIEDVERIVLTPHVITLARRISV